MTLHTTGKIGTARRAPARIHASADRGWMSKKHPLLAEEEECFYLTSSSIEPDGPAVDVANFRERLGALVVGAVPSVEKHHDEG